MEPIIKELTPTEVDIASLKRQVEFLKEKVEHLNEQILRQVNINAGFIKMFETINNK